MKKFITIISVIICLSTITGCAKNNVVDTSNDFVEYYSEMEKAQKIEIVPTDKKKTSQTLSNKNDILQFIDTLAVDKWELTTLPVSTEISGTFVFSQNETIQLGKNKMNLDSYEAIKIYSYKDCPYVTIKIADLDFDFKVSKNTAKYLNTLTQ
ncbi:MAG TPA: hypothetical protein IAC41_01575 [Candidatus Merdenecus merdavium]|nr:hypothetical protein [Candidatus Merdenecus merdavium]